MVIEPYEELANAIVAMAARDYRRAVQKINLRPGEKKYLDEKKSIERFFNSEYYKLLTNVDCDAVINKILQEEGVLV